MLAVKQDGTYRFCVDYRKLNACTIKDSYPLPTIQDSLDMLGGSCYFSALDMMSGYWQIKVNRTHRGKTTFVSHMGAYAFKRMPFGLTNAPACFQRCMDSILSSVKNLFCMVYLDDVIIFTKSAKEHLNQIDEVLTLLENAGAKLKLEKCHFFKQKLKYLGHVISKEGVEINREKFKIIEEWKVPTNKKECEAFIGFTNFYRKFIKDVTLKMEPINKVTYSKPFIWNEAADSAFKQLKRDLTTSTILKYADFTKPFYLDTDFSKIAVGAVLYQQQGVIGYFSKKIRPYQSRYWSTEGEWLAIVEAARHFKPYLLGQTDTVVYTDNNALNLSIIIRDIITTV